MKQIKNIFIIALLGYLTISTNLYGRKIIRDSINTPESNCRKSQVKKIRKNHNMHSGNPIYNHRKSPPRKKGNINLLKPTHIKKPIAKIITFSKSKNDETTCYICMEPREKIISMNKLCKNKHDNEFICKTCYLENKAKLNNKCPLCREPLK